MSGAFIHLRVHSSYSLAEGAIKIVEDKPKDGHKAARKDLIQLCLQHHMPAVALLVQNELGYRNLSALVTQSFLAADRPVPFVTLEELAQHAGGLIALTGG